MKVRVIESFIDKHTNANHPVGEEFECKKERYEEIAKAGNYVEVVAENPKKVKTEK